jgi:tRNA G18 (ribose-2'-O)-methylase SpoU
LRENQDEHYSVTEPIHITSPADPRLDAYRNIRERDLSAREGIFIGETFVVLEAMLLRPMSIVSMLASARMTARVHASAMTAQCEAPLYTADDAVLEAVTGIDLHRGVLAVGRRADFEPCAMSDYAPSTPPRTVLVLEDCNNIDNIGQLFRIAAAFAVDAVLLSPSCHDPLYRKSLRVSTGNALKVTAIRAKEWPSDLREFCARFDLTLVATAIQSSVPIASLNPPSRVAIVVGHESNGVSDAVRALAQHTVRIPMSRGVDSLNVAVSAALALDRLSNGERI